MRDPILVLGKYEIVEAIGSGGMATVYRGKVAGPMGFEKPVAVKVLQEDVAADEEIVRMFIDEARLGARLSHPNVANVLDFGEAGGRYYMAMEYVDGVSLAGLLKHLGKGRKPKPLEPAVAVHVAACVLRGLAYAHGVNGPDGRALGIVHRDVSPQNVLLDRSGTVKLCDFGIATGSYRIEKTRVGVIKGKAGYMSPEQASGGKVDARSDLYSLALSIVAMLSGGPAYDGKDTTEVRGKAAKGLGNERIEALACDVALKEVLRRALAAKPADRFATASEFLSALLAAAPDPAEAGRNALAALLEKVPDSAARTGSPYRKKGGAPAAKDATAARSDAVPTTGLRNLLIVAGVAVLAALVLALLGVGMPSP
ncbi:MAG: serine/threonine protein kinase [Deltaproteobacteria bacterium]|nr:serine/threonine protein kinase [Deltaproteobacteria bacterium]